MLNYYDFIQSLVIMISKMFGSNCEVLFHDLRSGHDHSIKFIENGHVTGRTVGDPANNIMLEVINSGVFQNRFNSITHTKDGKTLNSSTVYLTDDENKAIGAFCINLDISHLLSHVKDMSELLPEALLKGPSVESYYANNVNDLLEYLISQEIAKIGKQPAEFTKEERLTFVGQLDAKGAFLITRSSDKVCEALGVSKYTLYSDLNEIKNKKNDKEEAV